MSARLNRGPPATVSLFFDGSASPNPGPAGWGARATIKIRNNSETLQWSAPIGHTTNNVAEYLGLISGLRRIINFLQSQSIRHPYARLRIQGDSRLVIDQLTGHSNVTSTLLSPLHIVASNLVARFMNVEFIACSRDQNEAADRLANQARQANPSPAQQAIYYPALSNLVDAWVANTHTLASHDILTAGSDPSIFIDAAFLQSLPGGKLLISTLQDPHPLSIVMGQVTMTVLGITTLDLGVAFSRRRRSQPNSQPEQTALVDVVVVHSMPVPMHVSHRHPQVGRPETLELNHYPRFESESLPEPYSQHRYWHNDTNFIFCGFEG